MNILSSLPVGNLMSFEIEDMSSEFFPSRIRTAMEQIIFDARYLEIVLSSKLNSWSRAFKFTFKPSLALSNVALKSAFFVIETL